MAFNDMSYMYPLFPIIATITMLLCLYPVPAHWRVGNIATVSLALWTSIGLLQCIINACIWHGNMRNPYPIWGDIVNVYFAVVSTAIAGCALSVQYRLWQVARAKTVFISKREKGRQRWTTCFLCFGFPIILAGLHYVVQDQRYMLIEDLGPITETYNVTLSFPLYSMWEPIFCILSAVFGIMTVRIILKRRKIFDAILNSGSTNVSKDSYMRLLCLVIFSMVVHTPLSMWTIIINSTQLEVYPWISWQNTHSNFSSIIYITRFMISIQPHDVAYLSITWWSLPLCGLSFFVFFGFGEAATPYQPLIARCLRSFGIQYSREEENMTKSTILRRPGKALSTESFGLPSMPHFGTVRTSLPTSGQIQTGTFAIDSVITTPQFTFRDAITQGSNETVEEVDKKQNAAQGKATFDVEAQMSRSEQWRHEIPERDSESTEEVTF